MYDGTGGLGQLDRCDADATGRGVHQHPLAGLQRPVAVQCRPGSRIVHRYGRTLLEAHRRRQGDGVGGAGIDDLGVAAEPGAGQHPLADAGRVDTVPDGVDGPRHLVADHRRQFRRIGIQPDPGQVVGEIHPRRPHPDPHLPGGGWRRVGPVLYLQHGWGTGLGDDDDAHGLQPIAALLVIGDLAKLEA